MEWRDIYINGIDSGYDIHYKGMIRYNGEIIDTDVLEVDGRYHKIEKYMLLAYVFDDNMKQKESILKNRTHYTDKQVVYDAILIEESFNGKQMEGTEEERVHKACQLLTNPEIRPIFIHRITGLSRKDLQLIYERKKWNDISRDYIFPLRHYSRSKEMFSDSQIHEACTYIERKIPFKTIRNICGLSIDMIYKIYNREVYQMISMWYEFPYIPNISKYKRGQYLSTYQVRQACALMESSTHTYEEISDFCKIDCQTLYDIRDRKILTFISEDWGNLYIKYSDDPMVTEIVDLMSKDWSKNEIISKIQLDFDEPSRNKIECEYRKVRRIYFGV